MLVMDEDVVNDYIEKMPPQLIKAILTLSSTKRWAVYLALLEHEQMYFSEIKELFRAKPQSITYILKDFTNSGLIHRNLASPKDIGNNNRVYYKPTTFGINLVKGLIDSALPKKIEKEIKFEDSKLLEPLNQVMKRAILQKRKEYIDHLKNGYNWQAPPKMERPSLINTSSGSTIHMIGKDWDRKEKGREEKLKSKWVPTR